MGGGEKEREKKDGARQRWLETGNEDKEGKEREEQSSTLHMHIIFSAQFYSSSKELQKDTVQLSSENQ